MRRALEREGGIRFHGIAFALSLHHHRAPLKNHPQSHTKHPLNTPFHSTNKGFLPRERSLRVFPIMKGIDTHKLRNIMTSQAASATYSLITYSNAYSNVLGTQDAHVAPEAVTLSGLLRAVAFSALGFYTKSRMAAQRQASLRRAARDVAAAEAEARNCERLYPAMAQELRAAAAHRMGQFD